MVEPIVKVEQGQLKGKPGTDLNGGIFYGFQGIPYAKAPVGELRFKAPFSAEPWSGVRDATTEGSESIAEDMRSLMSVESDGAMSLNVGTSKAPFPKPGQKVCDATAEGSESISTLKTVGSEDCLFLNVFTPQLPSGNNNTPKAVMVWIHGGGFTNGSSKSEFYGPEFLLKEDIVLVTINYRLGILGFLSLEDTALGVPGNAGLKDMVLALKWVQKNISQFGGDANNVTIFGESAGSAACEFLMLSPMAKGLFHRAILQSGSTLNPWVFGKRNAIEIAKILGHECKDEKGALTFLRSVPAKRFMEAQNLLKDSLRIDEDRPFCPVIEKPHSEAFLTEDPLKLMLSGNYNKVPLIIGYTNREGMLMEFVNKVLDAGEGPCDYRKPNFDRAIPKGYASKGTDSFRNIAKKIDEFYYKDSKTPEDDMDAYYKLYSDTYFIHGIQNSVKSLIKTQSAPIYLYRFSLESILNFFKALFKISAKGASHGDDIGYLFKSIMTPKFDPKGIERTSIDRITKLWTNFAKTGNPNPTVKDSLIDVAWPRVTADAFNCLEIGEKISIVKNPDADRMQFWDDIAKCYISNS